MAYDRNRHLREMYERDMVRWKQGRGEMPVYSDYIAPEPSESWAAIIAKMIGLAVAAVVGPTLAMIAILYVLFS